MACCPACDRATKRRCRLQSITSAAASPPLRRYHEAGNIGVEHAAPGVIRAALAAPRRSDPGRQVFSREDLLAAGLVAELHARVSRIVGRSCRLLFISCPACSFQSWPGAQHCGWEDIELGVQQLPAMPPPLARPSHPTTSVPCRRAGP